MSEGEAVSGLGDSCRAQVVRARDDEGAVGALGALQRAKVNRPCHSSQVAMTSSPEPLIVEAEQNFTVPYVEAAAPKIKAVENLRCEADFDNTHELLQTYGSM